MESVYRTLNQDLWEKIYQNVNYNGLDYPHEPLVRFVSLMPPKSKDKKALEIGFGSAVNAIMMAEKGYYVEGLEVSPSIIGKAKKRFNERTAKSINLSLWPNCPKIDFDNDYFDIVASHQAIYYNIALESVLHEIKRVLKPAGRFFLSFFSPNDIKMTFGVPVTEDIIEWGESSPFEGLIGMRARYFKDKEKLSNVFSPIFDDFRIDTHGSNILDQPYEIWIVSGSKGMDSDSNGKALNVSKKSSRELISLQYENYISTNKKVSESPFDEIYRGLYDGLEYPNEPVVRYASIIPKKENKRRALEIGFGLGANSAMMAERGYRVIGLDQSPSIVENVNKRLEGMNNDNVRFDVWSSYPKLDFQENTFDLVVSYDAIYYLFELEGVLSEIKKVLSVNGRFFISFFTPNDEKMKFGVKSLEEEVEWDSSTPFKRLVGKKARSFKDKEALAKIFSNTFDNFRIDNFKSEFLAQIYDLWIVTGSKSNDVGLSDSAAWTSHTAKSLK